MKVNTSDEKPEKLERLELNSMKLNRVRRHKSMRKYLTGIEGRPRLAVFRSSQHIYAQIIDDTKSVTIAAESDSKASAGTKTQKAYEVGKSIAQKAIKLGVSSVVFDRGGFLYHGRIKALADGAREGGLKF